VVLAGLKTMNGQFEFFNVDEMETMATSEHFMATDVEWDPTGRYVTTAVTSVHQMENGRGGVENQHSTDVTLQSPPPPLHTPTLNPLTLLRASVSSTAFTLDARHALISVECLFSTTLLNGFHLWTFNGKLLYKHQKERFYQFLWRPRAPTLHTPEQEAEIVRNLKKYSKRFEELDESIRNQQDTHLAAEKQGVTDDWKNWLATKRAALVDGTPYATKLRALMLVRYPEWKREGGDNVVEEEVQVEEFVSIEEVPFVQ